MALYNSTRLLIDPSTIQMAEQAKQNRLQNYFQAKDAATKGWINAAQGVGQNLGQGILKVQRDIALENDKENAAPYVGTPEYKAAAQHFYETGDASQLNQLKMAYEAQQAREQEKASREAEALATAKKAAALEFDKDAVLMNDLENKYVQETDPFEQDNILAKMEQLNKKWSDRGQQLIDPEKMEQRKAWKKQKENAQAKFDVNEDRLKNMVRKAETKEEKDAIIDMMQNESSFDIDPERKQKMLDWATEYQTPGEKKAEAVFNARLNYTTGKAKEKWEATDEEKKELEHINELLKAGKPLTRKQRDLYNKSKGKK